jgi:hypothetical protein
VGAGALLIRIRFDLAAPVIDEVSRFRITPDWFITAFAVATTLTGLVAGLVTRLITGFAGFITGLRSRLTLIFPFPVSVRVSCAVLRSLRPILLLLFLLLFLLLLLLLPAA